MRRIFATWLILCAALWLGSECIAARGQTQVLELLLMSGGGGASCSQSSTWFKRVTGLSATEHSAQDTMICGLVTDGVWCGTTMDALYFFATNTTANAKLNMCSTSFSLAQTGSPTFTADTGFTGDAAAAFFDTGFNPSTAGGNLVLNSSHLGAYVLTSAAPPASAASEIGNSDKVASALTIANAATNNIFYQLSDACAPVFVSANVQGYWISTRTSSSSRTLYQNDSSVATDGSCNSVSLQSLDLYILARNGAGTADQFSGHQLAAVHFGSGLNSTQEHRIACRINQALTTMGKNVYTNSSC